MKFRKKPVVIEAFQMTRERRSDNSEWPEWLNRAWNMDFDETGAVSCEDFPNSTGTDRLVIRTLEGVMYVGWDDWIIQGVKGELYACKPDIFAATYEPAIVLTEADAAAGLAGTQRPDHPSAQPPTTDAYVAVGSTRFSDGAIQTAESLASAQEAG